MTTKISIPKIPQNLPVEIRTPLDKLRQAVIELSNRVEEPIDGRTQIKFGTVTEGKIEKDLLTDIKAVRYYIEPTNGTAIKNSVGTLTIKATKVDGTGTNVLYAGNIKMYKPDGTLAGNGYTWTASAADINDSIIITLKDSVTKVEWDTITLIDVTDGGAATIGSVSASNGLAWTRAIDAGAWTPAATTTDLTCTFYESGASIATRVVRVTRDVDGTMTAALQSNNGEATTHNVTGSGSTAISIEFIHTASGLSVFETVLSVQGGISGGVGADGYSSATLTAYKRSASAPTDDPGDVVYTFASASWTPGNGWTQSIPAGTDPLYAISGTAFGQGATDTVFSADWSSPAVVGQDGADGLNVASVFIYQRTTADSAPALPTTASATFTFADGTLDALNNGWTRDIPAFTGANLYLWISVATASSASATDEILAAEWQAAVKLAQNGIDGDPGDPGFNTATLTAYKRASSAPTDDPGISITYTFATADWTPGNGWSKTIPAGTDPVYAVSATAYANTATDDVLSADWSAPTLILQDGAAGAAGLNTATVNLYNKNTSSSTPPSAFSGTFTYTFSTAVLSGGTLNGWTQDAPDISAGEYLWIRQAAAVANTTTDSVPTAEFAAAVVVGIGGSDGATGGTGSAGTDGINNAIVFLYHSNTSAVTPPTLFSGTFTYTFSTGVLSGGTLNGWAQSAPDIAAGEYLWLSQATASANTSTDSVPTAEFSTPAVIAIGGSDGAAGLNVATVFIYTRTPTDSAPSLPTTNPSTYTFATGALSALDNDWDNLIPAAGTDPYLWVSFATASSASPTDDIANTEWQTPQKLAESGAAGSAGANSRTVNLTAGQMAFAYLTDDTLNDNANTTITATALNTGGTPYYEFRLNGVSQQDSTSNTWTYTPQASYSNMPDVVEVHLTEDSVGGTIYARDQITIVGIKPGVDAPLVVQSNESHTVPFDNGGTANYTGSGNTLSVYIGATQIPYDSSVTYASPSFRVTSAVGSGITVGTPTENANDITYGVASAMTTTTATITYTIVVKNNEGIETTITRVQSFSKSTDGTDGTDGGYKDIKFQRSSSAPSTPTGNNPGGWSDSIPVGSEALWQIIGLKNSAGDLQGVWSTPERIVGLTYRGPWSSATAYLVGDMVSYSERSYICVQDNTNQAPSGTNSGNAYWDLLAGKGDTGNAATDFTETIAITGTAPVNLRALADSHSPAYDGVGNATITYTLASGVTITGVANGGNAIDTGSWPAGVTIDLDLSITGTVRGGGGRGGAGGDTGDGGSNGGLGGDAIYCQEDIDIVVNSGGVVQAGGGGGGGGGGGEGAGENLTGGGGGGGGFPNGSGGAAGSGTVGSATAGSPGTVSGGGAGGGGMSDAGDGGAGGGVNTSGTNGQAGGLGGGGTGRAAGYAVRKNGNTVGVTNNGTITGTQG